MKRRGKGDKLPPFVALTWKMLNSQAYKELQASSAKGLPYFLGKVKCGYNDPQRYTAEFSFPYAEGRTLGFALGTFSKVIQNLIHFGFIDPVDKGGLRGDCKSYNLFRLSRRWEFYGTRNFEEVKWSCFMPKPR